MKRDRLIASALLLPVGAAVVVSLVRLVGEVADVPDDDDYAAAARFLDARQLRNDDAIVILPPWSLRPLVALGQNAERVVGGDGPWFELSDHRYARLFLLEEPDGAPWRPGLSLPPAQVSVFGALSLSEFDLGPARYDFKARLGEAHVDVDAVHCERRVKNGVGCGGADWQRVAREWALVSENGREIIWAHPPPAGQRLRIVFPDVALGRSLVVAAGHTREGAEHAHGPVRLEVRIDDNVIATLVREPSFVVEPLRAGLRSTFVTPVDAQGQGFRVEHIDTARFANTRHQVGFVIDSDDEASQDFGFDAFIPAD